MKNFKQIISKLISENIDIDEKEIYMYIEMPKDSKNGDYSFPCFKLAKELKKAPPVIAQELKEKLDEKIADISDIEKVDIVGGYLNFYISPISFTNEVLNEFETQPKIGSSKIGEGKKIVIDYSAPNIAKQFHIGHLRSTVIGGALYRIYQHLGYTVIGINHIGDYGTQFGKLIEGYKMWGSEYDIEKDPINELTKIYVRISDLCKKDEKVLQACRDNFKKLEDGDEYCVSLWTRFRNLSLTEFQKVYDLLGSKFDSWNGEAFYSDKMPEIISILEKTGKLEESQGARIINLEDKGINTPCIIEKTNGSTTYATRDLAAIVYRARNYDFDKALYVVSY